jgi:hypothetical protein
LNAILATALFVGAVVTVVGLLCVPFRIASSLERIATAMEAKNKKP